MRSLRAEDYPVVVTVADLVARGADLRDALIANVDLGEVTLDWEEVDVTGAVFAVDGGQTAKVGMTLDDLGTVARQET